MIISLWHPYWAWVGGNIGAIPLEFAITAVAAAVFRKPIGRLVAWLRREEIAEARAARQITADLYLHHTGHTHHLAPDPESEAK
jgi:hypothetical protein